MINNPIILSLQVIIRLHKRPCDLKGSFCHVMVIALTIICISITFYSFKIFPNALCLCNSVHMATCDEGRANITCTIFKLGNWGAEKRFVQIKWRKSLEEMYSVFQQIISHICYMTYSLISEVTHFIRLNHLLWGIPDRLIRVHICLAIFSNPNLIYYLH